jgi:hypothetical protein
MRYFSFVFITLFALSVRAQVKFEHSYTSGLTEQFGLVNVDSAEWKYAHFNLVDSISIYNIDHSLDRIIVVPLFPDKSLGIITIAKNLFTTDGLYAYLMRSTDTTGHWNRLRILTEDNKQIFYRDSATLAYTWSLTGGSSIIQTNEGTKMIVRTSSNDRYEVYSLPGKLPSSQKSNVVDPSSMSESPSIPTSAYPNPTTGRVRIAYELPAGVSSGELVLMTVEGKEVMRYHVTNAFSDLLIEAGDLPSGSYFYKLVTEKGESEVRRIVRVK